MIIPYLKVFTSSLLAHKIKSRLLSMIYKALPYLVPALRPALSPSPPHEARARTAFPCPQPTLGEPVFPSLSEDHCGQKNSVSPKKHQELGTSKYFVPFSQALQYEPITLVITEDHIGIMVM